MRSLLTAFGVGAGLSLLAAGAFALIAPKVIAHHEDDYGVHVINIGDGDRGSFHLKDEGLDVSAEWKGDFALAGDGRSLSSLKESFEVTSKQAGVTRKAIFTRKGETISAETFVEDRAEPAGAASEKTAGDLLQLFARSSGVGAETRVKAMLASGGKSAVIDEIGKLEGSHSIGAYIEALAGATTLAPEDIKALTAEISGIDSDYAKRSAISALLTTQQLDDASIADIMTVAKSIEGDHELRLIIEELAEKPLNDRNYAVAASLIDEIEGDHEIRLAVASLLESDDQSDANIARSLEIAAKAIEGDYELRLAIEAAGDRVTGPKAGAAALLAIAKIEGGHERRLAIEEVAGELDGASPHWLPLVEAAATVEGDYERRLAIEAVKSDAPETDEIHAALRKAAETIGSDHERRLALEATE
ncbi:MAG: hypothetical protein AAB227_06030 [Pseudomonadota bacterium]